MTDAVGGDSGTRLVSRPEHQHLTSSVLPHHGPELMVLTDGGFWTDPFTFLTFVTLESSSCLIKHEPNTETEVGPADYFQPTEKRRETPRMIVMTLVEH